MKARHQQSQVMLEYFDKDGEQSFTKTLILASDAITSVNKIATIYTPKHFQAKTCRITFTPVTWVEVIEL